MITLLKAFVAAAEANGLDYETAVAKANACAQLRGLDGEHATSIAKACGAECAAIELDAVSADDVWVAVCHRHKHRHGTLRKHWQETWPSAPRCGCQIRYAKTGERKAKSRADRLEEHLLGLLLSRPIAKSQRVHWVLERRLSELGYERIPGSGTSTMSSRGEPMVLARKSGGGEQRDVVDDFHVQSEKERMSDMDREIERQVSEITGKWRLSTDEENGRRWWTISDDSGVIADGEAASEDDAKRDGRAALLKEVSEVRADVAREVKAAEEAFDDIYRAVNDMGAEDGDAEKIANRVMANKKLQAKFKKEGAAFLQTLITKRYVSEASLKGGWEKATPPNGMPASKPGKGKSKLWWAKPRRKKPEDAKPIHEKTLDEHTADKRKDWKTANAKRTMTPEEKRKALIGVDVNAAAEHRKAVASAKRKGIAVRDDVAASVKAATPKPKSEKIVEPSAHVRSESTNSSPRESAAEKSATDDQYEFARASSVGNFGEDLKGSARHVRNEWRSLEQAESDGTAEKMVTRRVLQKVEPNNLAANITPSNAMATLAAHIILSGFPPDPGEYSPGAVRVIARSGNSPSPPEVLRKQYFDAYKGLVSVVESAAANEHDPLAVAQAARKYISDKIDELRGIPEKYRGGRASTIGLAMSIDQYNPVANGLVATYKKCVTGYRASKTSVAGRVSEFVGHVKKKYGNTPSADMLEAISGHVMDVIEGSSFNETFGTKGSLNRFKPSEAYVASATREGGRVIDASTVEAGKSFMLDSLNLRGVQWGNYVTDDERQHHLQKSAEALADLADVTGFPDSGISLGGTLGLAIGARGKAGALAHYEPDEKVINLTRASGVGSLAHEWGHAMDHWLGGFGNMASTQWKTDTPIGASMSALRTAIAESGFANRCREHIRDRIKAGTLPKNSMDYWLSAPEMFARVFERHVQESLKKSGRDNTYLVGLRKDGHPLWPTAEESEKIRPAMESLLAAVKSQHFS